MRVSKILLVMCAVWLSISTTSKAGIIVSVDMDPAAGIQVTNSAVVRVGDSFTAGIFMQTTAPSSLGVYNFSIAYGIGLAYTDRTETGFGNLREDDFNNNFSDNFNNLGLGGRAFRFDGSANLAQVQTNPLGPIQIGSITFNVLTETPKIIQGDLLETTFNLFLAGDLITRYANSDITFNSGTLTVTAVPEPTTAAMIGVSVASLIFGRRWSYRLLRQKP